MNSHEIYVHIWKTGDKKVQAYFRNSPINNFSVKDKTQIPPGETEEVRVKEYYGKPVNGSPIRIIIEE